MATSKTFRRIKIFTGILMLISLWILWTLTRWYDFLTKVCSFFAWFPVYKRKMAAPVEEKNSRASSSNDSPDRVMGSISIADPEIDSPNRGYFQSMPIVDITVQEQARLAEDQVITLIRTPIFREDVEVSRGIFIHTLRTRVPTCVPQDTIPILLVHGLVNGLGAWTMVIDELAQNRQVFAIDLLGFGRSTRFEFGDDSRTVEQQFIQSIEEWRRKVGLSIFILCGHSMGGYLSCAYALRYPEHVAHLILDDPWGFPESNKLTQRIGSLLMNETMPHFRGPRFIREASMVFLNRSFQAFNKYHGGSGQYFKDYLLAINQAEPPTGEKAFATLAMLFGMRAKSPMLSRLPDMDERVGVSFLIGDRSFLPYRYIHDLPNRCNHLKLTIKMIQGADHEVHITQAQQFTDVVNAICDRVDDLMPYS